MKIKEETDLYGSRFSFIRTMKGRSLYEGMETVPRCRGLGAFIGQQRELLGWKIPHAELFLCNLKVINTNGSWYVDFLLGVPGS